MNRLTIFMPLLLLAAAPAVAGLVPEHDRRALEQLAAANDAAWGAKDVATMIGQYAEGGTVRVAPNAPVIAGREPVAALFRQAFARRQGVHRHITTLDHVELISPDLALADGAVRVERREADGSWSIVRTFRNVSLVAREQGKWKLRSVRAIPQN